MALDYEVVQEVKRLARRTRELADLNITRDGLKEGIGFDLDRINRVCKSDEYEPQPYIDVYCQEFLKD